MSNTASGRGRRPGLPAGGARLLHPLAWVMWLLATVAALLSTRNPLYLAVILASIALTLRASRSSAFAPPLPISVWRFGLVVITISALFNGLMSHFGQTVLVTLPSWLPIIGGAVTLEGVLYGVINGLVLTGMFAAFLALYQATPIQGLIRLIPRAFYPAGVVVSVAVAYVPTTLTQFQQIREAQMMRGHGVRGVRDWLPLAMPLLIGGLERAMQLAEAMTARGFTSGATEPSSTPRWLPRLLLLGGLALLLAGLAARLAAAQTASGVLLAAGGLAVIAVLWLQGRQVHRTVYRPQPWTGIDWLVCTGALVTVALYLLPLPGLDQASLAWSPYPRISFPEINWLIALGTAGLAVPALVSALASRKRNGSPPA